MAMKKVAKKVAQKSKSGYGGTESGAEFVDRNNYYAAKGSKGSSPSAGTRTRTALQRPGSLKQPTGNERNSSSAMGGMFPTGKKKVTKGSKK